MKLLGMVLMIGGLAMPGLRCAAEVACGEVGVPALVTIASGTLTLADLLMGDSCGAMLRAAAQVSLGVAPRAGQVRVFDGQQVRLLIEALPEGDADARHAESRPKPVITMKIPERIVVRRAGAVKSCGEIAQALTNRALSGELALDSRGREPLDCAAAGAIPREAQLELTRTNWNAALQRREFSLRCAQPELCVPFMVWAREDGGHAKLSADRGLTGVSASPAFRGNQLLVKPGQTATLSWEQAGIRVVLPVTCLDAGGLGQRVRVRLKNGAQILRAEVMSDGTLQVKL